MFHHLPVDIGRKAEHRGQPHLEVRQQVDGVHVGFVEPAQDFYQEVEDLRVLLFLLHQRIDQLDDAKPDGDLFEVSADAVEGLDVGALAQGLEAPCRLVIKNHLGIRHRLERRPEAALEQAGTLGQHGHLAFLAREERDDLARLAILHHPQDNSFGPDDHGGRRFRPGYAGRTAYCVRMPFSTEYAIRST